jgi:hypothetical protein
MKKFLTLYADPSFIILYKNTALRGPYFVTYCLLAVGVISSLRISQIEDRPLPTVPYWLFDISLATFQVWRMFPPLGT